MRQEEGGGETGRVFEGRARLTLHPLTDTHPPLHPPLPKASLGAEVDVVFAEEAVDRDAPLLLLTRQHSESFRGTPTSSESFQVILSHSE